MLLISEVASKFLLPFKLHFLMSSFFNVVKNLLLSPTAKMKTTRVKGEKTPRRSRLNTKHSVVFTSPPSITGGSVGFLG